MRVIQDSDDEYDDLEANAPPPKQADPPNQQLAPSQSGTGSTESLKRAIHDAHHHHECPQSQDSQKEVKLPGHMVELSGKRRKTSAEHTPVSGLLKTLLSNDPVSTEVSWNLEGTIRDNYAIHDPMAMFPEPSSTIPNATLTQQHLMEQVTGPTMLGGELDHVASPSHLHPEPSIPWSDLMKFSPASPVEYDELPSRGQVLGAMPGSSNRHGTSQGQVSQVTPTSPKTQRESRQTPSLPQKQNNTMLDSEDDLTDIGLPKEQYKPRPSRSRSLQSSIGEPIDYSVKPEKAARALKGRNAKGTKRNSSIPTTPQKIQQICDMGFTPSTTERALTQNSGDIRKTVDWLLSNGIGEDELAPHGTPNKKILLKDKIVDGNTIVESDNLQSVVDEPTEQQEHVVSVPAGPKVQVVIRQTPPKRRKTTLDEPEPEPLPGLRDSMVPIATSAKKKGRGRPRKAVTVAVTTEALVDAPKGQVPTKLGVVSSEVVPPESTELNSKPASPHEPENNEDKASNTTPRTVGSEKAPTHSATNGKVPYRVGLSKRARIAPLLRTLKK